MNGIAEIVRAARAEGLTYGQYVNKHQLEQAQMSETPKQTCVMCGAEIAGAHKGKRYCTNCVEQRKREAAREHYRRNHPAQTMKCEVCGAEIVRKTGNQKRCTECSKRITQDRKNESNRKWRARKKQGM